MVTFDQTRSWALFDADRGIDSAREIREYFIPDFSNWKDHDSYAKGVRPAAARFEGRGAGRGECLAGRERVTPKPDR
jgi:hypothetical protein